MNIAIIPARGGSKRIPRKNIRDFEGKPIIAYSIETALASSIFSSVVVSTDDAEIMHIARLYGAVVIKRPAKLADDDTGTQEVIRHACMTLALRPDDRVCGIYPTAPMMTAGDLQRGLNAVWSGENHFSFSVGTEPLHDAGQWYWGQAHCFIKRNPLYAEQTVMVPIPALRVCDINTEEDWQWAVAQYRKLNGKTRKPTGKDQKGRSTTSAKR
jgi:pseudaminic acid cytidylyltransferase